jgi:hypothetical protein
MTKNNNSPASMKWIWRHAAVLAAMCFFGPGARATLSVIGGRRGPALNHCDWRRHSAIKR